MNIDSIQNGYVIDHIKAGHGMKVYAGDTGLIPGPGRFHASWNN